MDATNGELSVKIVEARGLIVPTIPGFFGILCPYVTIRLKEEERKTRMIDNTKDPIFGEKFLFEARLKKSDTLFVEVWNHKETDSSEEEGHPLIGGVTVLLEEILEGKQSKLQQTIVDHLGQPKGKIFLEVSWEEKEDIVDACLSKLSGSRPWYLRTQDCYQLIKDGYAYGSTFPIIRSVTPVVESVAEGFLLKAGVKTTVPEDSLDAEEQKEKALQVVDAKLVSLLQLLDTKVDDGKDSLLSTTKTTKNKIKNLAIETHNQTRELIINTYSETVDRISNGVSYVKEVHNKTSATAVEQVQAVSKVTYDVLQPYMERFPIIGKYFEELEELAEEAAELVDASIEVREKLEDLGIVEECSNHHAHKHDVPPEHTEADDTVTPLTVDTKNSGGKDEKQLKRDSRADSKSYARSVSDREGSAPESTSSFSTRSDGGTPVTTQRGSNFR